MCFEKNAIVQCKTFSRTTLFALINYISFMHSDRQYKDMFVSISTLHE